MTKPATVTVDEFLDVFERFPDAIANNIDKREWSKLKLNAERGIANVGKLTCPLSPAQARRFG